MSNFWILGQLLSNFLRKLEQLVDGPTTRAIFDLTHLRENAVGRSNLYTQMVWCWAWQLIYSGQSLFLFSEYERKKSPLPLFALSSIPFFLLSVNACYGWFLHTGANLGMEPGETSLFLGQITFAWTDLGPRLVKRYPPPPRPLILNMF